MCGFISGFIKNSKIINYEDLLAPRGPDGRNFIEYEEYGFQALFRRLKLVGDTIGSDQPVRLANHVLVFNGEIYNYKELANEYKFTGLLLPGFGDTDVLSQLLVHFKFDLFQILPLLRGMFAISLTNLVTHEMQLARDYFGKKPLFYSCTNDNIVASSNATIVSKLINNNNISKPDLLNSIFWGYVRKGHSIWENVLEVLPGEYIKITKKTITKNHYEILPCISRSFKEDLILSIESRVDKVYSNSIFLSDGRDSNIINKILSRYTNLITYNIKFGKGQNHCNDYNNIIYYDKKIHFNTLHELLAISDEPVLDLATFPLYYTMKNFTNSSQKVFFTGDGADELDFGYLWYKRILLSKRFSLPISNFNLNLNSKYINSLLTNNFNKKVNIIRSFAPYKQLEKYNLLLQNDFKSISDVNEFDIKTFMPQTILKKLDRSSMFASKEIRSPFLDEDLFINHHQNSLYGKPNISALYKDLFGNRPAVKRGFDLPVRMWIDNRYDAEIGKFLKLVNDLVGSSSLLNTMSISDIRRNPYLYWNLLQASCWFKYNLKNGAH